MKILNLTLRPATKAQWDAGVIDLPQETMALLFEALTFRATPTAAMVGARAEEITRIACMGATKPEAALIDAPPAQRP